MLIAVVRRYSAISEAQNNGFNRLTLNILCYMGSTCSSLQLPPLLAHRSSNFVLWILRSITPGLLCSYAFILTILLRRKQLFEVLYEIELGSLIRWSIGEKIKLRQTRKRPKGR